MKVQRLKNDQIPAVVVLLKSFSLPTEDLESSEVALFGLTVDDKVVGCIGYEQFEELGLLRSLVVDKNHQGKGIAFKLVDYLEKHVIKMGMSHLFLLTETAESYFEKLDYRVIERSKTPDGLKASAEFSHLCPDTAVLMMKEL